MDITNYYKSINLDDDLFEGHSGRCNKELELLKELSSDVKIKNVLEIGFNAGHSADIFLSNKNIKLTSIDINKHSYINDAKKFIDSKYPNRHTLILGDSRIILPKLFKENKYLKYDLIFIDGCHYDDAPYLDLKNCINFAHRDTIIIMDDTQYNKEWVKKFNIKPTEVWEKFKNENKLKDTKSIDINERYGLSYGKYNFDNLFKNE